MRDVARKTAPALPVLPVRIGEPVNGRQRTRRPRNGFDLSNDERLVGLTVLAIPDTPDGMLDLDDDTVGHDALIGRGLIELIGEGPALRWGYPGAAGVLARRLCVPLQQLGSRATSMLYQCAYMADGSRTYPLSDAEVGIVMRHRYQFTGVHALTITPARASDTGGEVFEIVEHRHTQPDQVRLLPRVPAYAGRLRQACAVSETHTPQVILPADVEAMVLDTYFRPLPISGSAIRPALRHETVQARSSVRLDLDRLTGQPPADRERADGERAGAGEWMPGLLADILTHLGVRVSNVPTREAYLLWAHEHLTYTTRCDTFTHVRRIDPITGTTHTPPEVAERQAAEDMLAALRLPVGESVGCAEDPDFLHAGIDHSMLQRMDDETLLRWLVRAAQYLDAGLDLRAAADFWFFAVPAAQAADLLAWRARDEAAVTSLLFGWCRDLLYNGTYQVPQVPQSG